MKKEYLTPNIEIVEVELRSIIATSLTEEEAASGDSGSTVNFSSEFFDNGGSEDW